eukprot:6262117-Ditylum_brightwellii.AAC.1
MMKYQTRNKPKYLKYQKKIARSKSQIWNQKSSLDTEAAIGIDIGHYFCIWVGKKSSKCEQSQAMIMVQNCIEHWEFSKTIIVVCVMDGQGRKVRAWKKAFK